MAINQDKNVNRNENLNRNPNQQQNTVRQDQQQDKSKFKTPGSDVDHTQQNPREADRTRNRNQ